VPDTSIPVTTTPRYLGVILDPSLSFSEHIDRIVTRARKRLNILKVIAGKDWGANAEVLSLTYKALIRPLLEYAIPAWCSASPSQLEKLDRVQYSAARIICGLRNTCPTNIAEFEANLLPLACRRTIQLEDFILKRKQTSAYHRTGAYINKWTKTNRIKKQSPMDIVQTLGTLAKPVTTTHTITTNPPHQKNPEIRSKLNLDESFIKKDTTATKMRSLGEKMIQDLPRNSSIAYTDGSALSTGQSGSGAHIILPNRVINLCTRNPNWSSNYRAELTAIENSLQSAIGNECSSQNLFIISDSQSAIQSVKQCFNSRDNQLHRIAQLIQRISNSTQIHLHWIPSHVGIHGNEVADTLARQGTVKEIDHNHKDLSAQEYKSLSFKRANKEWRASIKHDWYSEKTPGATIQMSLSRADQSIISRFKTGHLRRMEFHLGHKTYPTCAKCSQQPASPQHILDCLQMSKEWLYERPKEVIQKLEEYGLKEMV